MPRVRQRNTLEERTGASGKALRAEVISVQEGLPVRRNFPFRPRNRLILGVPTGRREMCVFAVDIFFRHVIVEPRLARFKTGDDRVTCFLEMLRGMLVR